MPIPSSDTRGAEEPGLAPGARRPAPGAAAGTPNLDTILRIPVVMQIVLGRAQMPVANLMKLGRGSVVVGDRVAFFLMGELVEDAPADRLFTRPSDPRTNDYLSGRFG